LYTPSRDSLRGFAPHERLLVRLARRDHVRGPFDEDVPTLENVGTRARFTRLAMQHRIHGLVLTALLRSPVVPLLSPEVVRECQASWHRLRRQAVIWVLERDRLLGRLERQGLTPITLKGGALQDRIYTEPAERSLGDLDLLLPPGQLEPARSVLGLLGYRAVGTDELTEAYRRYHHHFRFAHSKGFIVEIHWALSPPGITFQLDERAFLARAIPTRTAGGQELRIPSAEDMVLHMASQSEEDAFARFGRLVDLDRVVAATPSLDWAYLQAASRTAGVQVLLGLSLRLAEVLLRTPVPTGFIDSLGLPLACRVSLALLHPVSLVVSEPAQRRMGLAELLLVWTTAGWRRRLRRAWIAVRPEADPFTRVYLSHADDGPGESTVRPGSLRRLVGLACWQAWVFLCGLGAMLTSAGRRRLRFWTDDPE
jgi:hypothetical protein